MNSNFNHNDCPLCVSAGGVVLFQHAQFRVVDACEPLYPGFLRLIWQAHVREFSALSRDERMLCCDVLVVLEHFVLERFKPYKVNLASLGNVVPHLHWHIIPRYLDDAHFPAPVWAEPKPASTLTLQQQHIVQTQKNWHEEIHANLTKMF